MTQEEITYNIASLLGESNNPSLLRRLKKQVDYYRETFFMQDFRRGRKLLNAYLQTIPYIATEVVDITEIGDFGIGEKIIRSKRKLPKLVNIDNGYAIKYIGTIDYSREFSVVDINMFKYQSYSRYSKKAPVVFFRDEYLYVANAYPDALSIVAMFSNPTALGDWKTKDGEQLFKFGDNYPITSQLIQRITQAILSVETQVTVDDANTKPDTSSTQTQRPVQ